MRVSSRILPALAVLFLLLAGAQNVFADSATFDFSFTGPGFSGSGMLAATFVSGDKFLVTSIISGTQTFGTGPALAMTLLPPRTFANNDNIISSSSPFLSLGGLAFVLSNGTTIYDIYFNFFPGPPGYFECNNTAPCNVGGQGTPITFTLTEAPPTEVPEPGSLMLLGSGLIGLAGVARRKLRG
jgi:hypothetical protein